MKPGRSLAFGLITLVGLLFVVLVGLKFHLVAVSPHYDPFAPPDLRERPYWLTSTKLKLIDSDGSSCAAALGQANLNNILLPKTDESRSCHLADTVMLNHFSSANLKSEQTRCNIAARLYLWERFIVQPAALAHFGLRVKEITHFGSYNCRTIHNSSHMSEHATANAFDISGFVLKNGKAVTVKRAWAAGGEEQAFLHDVRNGLCQFFNLTLSPDYNADHADHFHVDMGWVRDCR